MYTCGLLGVFVIYQLYIGGDIYFRTFGLISCTRVLTVVGRR